MHAVKMIGRINFKQGKHREYMNAIRMMDQQIQSDLAIQITSSNQSNFCPSHLLGNNGRSRSNPRVAGTMVASTGWFRGGSFRSLQRDDVIDQKSVPDLCDAESEGASAWGDTGGCRCLCVKVSTSCIFFFFLFWWTEGSLLVTIKWHRYSKSPTRSERYMHGSSSTVVAKYNLGCRNLFRCQRYFRLQVFKTSNNLLSFFPQRRIEIEWNSRNLWIWIDHSKYSAVSRHHSE